MPHSLAVLCNAIAGGHSMARDQQGSFVRLRTDCFSVLGMILLSCAGAEAFGANGRDCAPAAVRQAESRVFAPDGRMRDLVYGQDALLLSMCVPRSRARDATRLEAALFNHYEHRACKSEDASARACLRTDDNSYSPVPVAKHVRATCDAPDTCYVEYFVRRSQDSPAQPSSKQFGKSGGLPLAGLLGHTGVMGHYEVTRVSLEGIRYGNGLQVSSVAVEILADASRDADFYDWLTPAAHAQADMDPVSGELIESSEVALRRYFAWTRDRLDAVRARCTKGQIREAAYLLGYALHGIQDFVFHEGMSNSEHSWRDQVQKLAVDSDFRYEEKMALAIFATREFLSALSDGTKTAGDAPCLSRIYAWKGAGALRFWEKSRVLDKPKGMDMTPDSILAFRQIGRTVDRTHRCTGCPPEGWARIVLEDKWLGWDKPEAESRPATLQQKVRSYVRQLFDSR